MKKLDKWVLSWLQIKTIIILKCHFLLFYTPTLNHFSTGFLHATKCGFSMTIGDDQFSGWTKKKLHSTSQSQICTKKRSWSLCGGLLPMGTTTAFWIPAKPLHLRSMLSKSKRCAENCHTCSSIGHQKGPNSSPWWCPTARCTTNTSKAERIALQSFASSAISPDLSPTDYYFFKPLDNFLQGKRFHNQPEAENTSQGFVESSWSMDFYVTGINKLISHWQKCVDCNGSYFDEQKCVWA